MTWKQVRGSWVLARDGAPLGRINDVVVNPNTGDIPALWIRTADETKLLAIDEIQRWTRNELFVDSPADLISPEEFPRLEEVLQQEVSIINAPVFEQHKEPLKIGTCHNFSFDTLSPKLVSIEISSGWFLWKNERIINRRQILEMKNNGIFVSAPLIKEPEKESSPTEILRSHIPEPETSQTFRGQ